MRLIAERKLFSSQTPIRVSVSREEGVSRISCTGAGDAVLATAGCGLLLVTSQNPHDNGDNHHANRSPQHAGNQLFALLWRTRGTLSRFSILSRTSKDRRLWCGPFLRLFPERVQLAFVHRHQRRRVNACPPFLKRALNGAGDLRVIAVEQLDLRSRLTAAAR